MKNLLLIITLILSNVIGAQKSNTIRHENILEFKIPKKYELRTNAKLNQNKEKILQNLDFKGSKSQYVLQPVGMNNFTKANKMFSRILIKIEFGDFDSNKKTAEYSEDYLENLEMYFRSAIEKLPNTQIVKTSPVTKMNFKDKNFLDFESVSKINQDAEILDRTLTFINKTYLIRFTISYRVTEEEYWSNDIQEFLNSIVIKDGKLIKKALPQKQKIIQKKKLTPMQLKVLQDSKDPNNEATIRSMRGRNK